MKMKKINEKCIGLWVELEKKIKKRTEIRVEFLSEFRKIIVSFIN